MQAEVSSLIVVKPVESAKYRADCVQCLGKSRIINRAIQDIGMGRYQWELFILCGMGWLADK